MSVAPYPHVEIGVKDASIYVPIASENLPLHKPLYMMKTQRGPIGVPVWCPTYTDAVKTFGADTFNKLSKFYSENAYFLLKTFPMNGAFIMRVADSTVKSSAITLMVGISETKQDVPQYQRDLNGQFVRDFDGSLIPINETGGVQEYEVIPVYGIATEANAETGVTYYTKTTAGVYVELTGITAGAPLPRTVYTAVPAGEAFDPTKEYYVDSEGGKVLADITEFAEGVTYYTKSEIVIYKVTGETYGDLEPQGTLKGYKLVWRAVCDPDRVIGDAATTTSNGYVWYPMMDIITKNPGSWGDSYGVKLFFDPKNNTISAQQSNSASVFTLAPIELAAGATAPSEVVDAYGQSMVDGLIRPKMVDPETEVDLSLEKLIPLHYSGKQALPITVTFVSENWNTVGKELMKAEIAQRAEIHTLYPLLPVVAENKTKTYVDDLVVPAGAIVEASDLNAASVAGYMTNGLSNVTADNIPYFTTVVIDSTDDAVSTWPSTVKEGIVVPSADYPIYLKGGLDGNIDDPHVEEQIRAQISATINGTQEYMCDYWRCPFNSIIDTGVSMKTKKAYLDLMAVRDDVVINLSTQVTWKSATGAPVVNTRYQDESNGSFLRSYALLMKEDVANGTGACRCKIFLHAGYRSDHDGMVASTLWIALKNAEYLNKDYIDKEAKELPNAAVECWSEISWVAYNEDTKSRCWNAGLNYIQHYSMSYWHYASVRSVYTYETSVLVDAGVVDALTFCKGIIRKSWSKFAGSTRKAAVLNAAINKDLNEALSYMLNGKFECTANAYQTDEDVKLGFCRHVQLELTAPGTNRVWKALIVCKREGYDPSAEA